MRFFVVWRRHYYHPFSIIYMHEKAPTVRKGNYVYTLSQFLLVGALYFSIFDTSLSQKRDKVCHKTSLPHCASDSLSETLLS
jgi:hypothetical protein